MANAMLRDHGRTGRLLGTRVVATGSYVPSTIVTNEDLTRTHGFSDDWVFTRTGIRERRFADPEQATSDLCYEAARRCIDEADVAPGMIDLVVVATYTPDMCFPSTACLVQDKLGLRCAAFDLEAACAGFVYALVTAAQFVATGASRYALVVGGDVNSRILNPNDQRSFPLFGDGAGAVLVGPTENGSDQGLLAFSLGADGSGGHLLSRPACGSRMPPTPEHLQRGRHYLQMDGRAIFKWAVRILVDSCEEVVAAAECKTAEVDLFVPHQANMRIINAASEGLGIDDDRVFCNLARYGNTSAGSIPLALDEARRAGRIGAGDLILTSGFGAGLAWGSILLRW